MRTVLWCVTKFSYVECIEVGMHNENFEFNLVSITKFKLLVYKKDCTEFLFCFEISFNFKF